MKRKNLHLLTDTQVRKIHVVAGSASGVVLQNAAGEQTIRANREIILSAGAIGSPQLLEVSGIGSAPILEKAGVALVHHLPGVGENLIDHLQTRISLKARNTVGLNERSEEHTSELQSLMRISYAVFCLKKTKTT